MMQYTIRLKNARRVYSELNVECILSYIILAVQLTVQLLKS